MYHLWKSFLLHWKGWFYVICDVNSIIIIVLNDPLDVLLIEKLEVWKYYGLDSLF